MLLDGAFCQEYTRSPFLLTLCFQPFFKLTATESVLRKCVDYGSIILSAANCLLNKGHVSSYLLMLYTTCFGLQTRKGFMTSMQHVIYRSDVPEEEILFINGVLSGDFLYSARQYITITSLYNI